ncbi:hypothetical protein MTO96_012927 [Rhipicephalus appendiculatus]
MNNDMTISAFLYPPLTFGATLYTYTVACDRLSRQDAWASSELPASSGRDRAKRNCAITGRSAATHGSPLNNRELLPISQDVSRKRNYNEQRRAREEERQTEGEEGRRVRRRSGRRSILRVPAASEWRRREASVRQRLDSCYGDEPTAQDGRRRESHPHQSTNPRLDYRTAPPRGWSRQDGAQTSFLPANPPPPPLIFFASSGAIASSVMPPGRKQARPGRTNPSAEPGPKEKRKPKSAREE